RMMPAGGSATDEDATRASDLALLEPRLRAMHDEGRLGIALRRGNALDAVLADVATQRADLLLVGSRNAEAGRRVLERRLAMTAPCSVWVVPERAPVSLARILVPVDFSGRSGDALAVATAIAAAAGSASCHAVHVRFDPSRALPEDGDHIAVGREREAFAIFSNNF
ncbi:MAG: hypothetical protein R6W90_17585, partial [Ignavibacteriaceae bacterium]